MIVDITDKLNFEESPKLKIKNVTVEVNADAPTMLKVMQRLGNGDDMKPKDISDMYELLFDEKERKKLDAMKLSFNDFQTVIMGAVSALTGVDMDEVSAKKED